MQTAYGYNTPAGVPGGLFDLSNNDIVARSNEAETGKMKFGLGVTQGTDAGVGVKIPVSADTVDRFEGITVYQASTELDREGKIAIPNKATLSIMNYGKVYARVASSATVTYGSTAYLVTDGDEAGCFTNKDDATATSKVEIKGRFITAASDGLAVIELFNA